ncbi:kinase-like protein [Dendrothele bispora CBS 962.96]|uniref:Kinase-like protein n=1 Tax=Dendrothele bispora (strain CBS 962.96) TaxID=1314807 RepID=A0A4S8KWW4_DENBC|nr:kinase-like protein [Dendrothele bispora CBS 962.96]
MSLSWVQRKTRLQQLLDSPEDEDEDGLALDRLLHGHHVIGKTARTTEIDRLRFGDRDLVFMGKLDSGSFGVIDVVTCRLNSRLYILKSTLKKTALRARDQCSPQLERDILLLARQYTSPWVPHLLCAYQTPTHLNIVMEYAQGGSLWDVLESSPLQGRITEDDLRWWVPQMISAVAWCHQQGFAHRDIKPHNFVFTPEGKLMLIDFGSAAPLIPPSPSPGSSAGRYLIPKRYCLVPCGTCDYISPEVLKAHELALVALEMEDELLNGSGPGESTIINDDQVYGSETDWWSLGAMLYEMAYGVAPFFAEDVRRTYVKIVEHRNNLKFPTNITVSEELKELIHSFLTDAEFRLGRKSVSEIINHAWFQAQDINWGAEALRDRSPPPDLHLPQFSYANQDQDPLNPDSVAIPDNPVSELFSQPFAFSAFFQHSSSYAPSSAALVSPPVPDPDQDTVEFTSPGLEFLRANSVGKTSPFSQSGSTTSESAFIGFSWGPTINAFGSEDEVMFDDDKDNIQHVHRPTDSHDTPMKTSETPRVFRTPSWLTPKPIEGSNNNGLLAPPSTVSPSPAYAYRSAYSTPIRSGTGYAYRTPYRTPYNPNINTNLYSTPFPSGHHDDNGGSGYQTPYRAQTLPRVAAGGGTLPRRRVSDREAMRQLVDCVGLSARKKVLESGRKPRLLLDGIFTGGKGRRKELRFVVDKNGDGRGKERDVPKLDLSLSESFSGRSFGREKDSLGMEVDSHTQSQNQSHSALDNLDHDYDNSGGRDVSMNPHLDPGLDADMSMFSESTSSSFSSSVPPSPSPSPRPGSAMSMMSMISGHTNTLTMMGNSTNTNTNTISNSRRSATPTATMTTFGSFLSTPSTMHGLGQYTGQKEKERQRRVQRQGDVLERKPEKERDKGRLPGATNTSRGRGRSVSAPGTTDSVSSGDFITTEKKNGRGRGRGQSFSSRIESAVSASQVQGSSNPNPNLDLVQPKPPMNLTTSASTRSTSTLDSTFDSLEHSLELKHASIMEDIETLEMRLNRVSRKVSGKSG